VPRRFPSDLGDGKFHGAQLVLGPVAQQLQLRRAQDQKRGTEPLHRDRSHAHLCYFMFLSSSQVYYFLSTHSLCRPEPNILCYPLEERGRVRGRFMFH
jgi:hypothetical protein